MKIEVLHLEGCQNSDFALELVSRVVSEMRFDACVSKVEVKTMDDAKRLSFYGSPTIQVNGRDIDPSVRGQSTFAFG